MNKFKFYFIALAALSVLFSCNKSDDKEIIITPRPYADQYGYDMQVIQTYLKTHYIKEIVDNPGGVDDQDIVLEQIPNGGTQESIWNSPMLDSVKVDLHDIEYTVYYIKQRIGVGDSPSRVDEVLTPYEVGYLRLEGENNVTFTSVESVLVPTSYFQMNTLVRGWREILPLFKAGVLVDNDPGEPTAYENFGAGVMFIPPGLGYYNYATSNIPAYAQLMFKFKLYNVKRADQDGDGIVSNNEDIDGDGYFYDDDTDGDGIANYLDPDDDGDGRPTKLETSYVNPDDPNQTVRYYPYEGAAVDDPDTDYVDETLGIPRAFTGEILINPDTNLPVLNPYTQQPIRKPAADGSDFKDPGRLRRHLDKNAMPPYYDDGSFAN